MYTVKPYHDSGVTQLPDCMYKMKNITETLHPLDQSAACHSGGCQQSLESYPPMVQELLSRQDALISRLEALVSEVNGLTVNSSAVANSSATSSKQHQLKSTTKSKSNRKTRKVELPKDIVISCNPNIQARSLPVLLRSLSQKYSVLLTHYTHNSAQNTLPCMDLSSYGFINDLKGIGRSEKNMVVTWLWKDCEECEMMISPIKQTKIQGECNVAKYLMRLLGDYSDDKEEAAVTDHWLDTAACIASPNNGCKADALAKVAAYLAKHNKLSSCDELGAEDVIMGSVLLRCAKSSKQVNDKNIKKWLSAVQNQF